MYSNRYGRNPNRVDRAPGHDPLYRALPALQASSRCNVPAGSDFVAASAHTSCPRHDAPGATRIVHTLPHLPRAQTHSIWGHARRPGFLMLGNTTLAVAAVRLACRAQLPRKREKNLFLLVGGTGIEPVAPAV